MSGFIRRFTEIPTIEVIKQIEGVVVIDLAPPDPATGAGSGTVLIVGEFEDGFFATDPDILGAVEVFGSQDFRTKFGGFGYLRNNVEGNDPCARRHLQELWNGNGWLKSFKLRAQRLLVSRVDTSVGSVSFDVLPFINSAAGPFVVPNGHQLSIATDQGGPANSTAISGVVATQLGAGGAFATINSGDAITLQIDGGPVVKVVFGVADVTAAACAARINAAMGFTCATVVAGELQLVGLTPGTDGSIDAVSQAPLTLTKLGFSEPLSVAGTGNVGNLNAVTGTEVAQVVNSSVALAAIDVFGQALSNGGFRVYTNDPAATQIFFTANTGAPFGISNSVASASDHAAGVIPAGTRVSNGTSTWLTMQTLDIPAGAIGPFEVRVRPALDDGSVGSASLGTVTTLVDPAPWGMLAVNNPAPLSAALSETQLDFAYQEALDRTLDDAGVCHFANFLLCARRSDAVVRAGRDNALKATACGLYARKFITGDPLGTSISQILSNVAKWRSDRVFYTGKGLKVYIPQIANLGLAGGLGFTADGVITVRPDGPLTTLCAMLPPEENPGQRTNMIDDFYEVDAFGDTLNLEAYEAFKAGGVAVPRIDRISGTVFQSGVTSSLDTGRKTMARRKMADFIQDTAADLFTPFVKKLNKQARRDKVRAVWDQFLAGLQAVNNPELSRIEAFRVDDSKNAGNTPEVLAQGVYYLQTVVRTYSSLDDIVVQTEIGENAVVSTS